MTIRISPTELERIQHWMQAVIMYPEGIVAGIDLPESRRVLEVAVDQVEDVICRYSAQSRIERLHVYANAYYATLLEVLASEFPTPSPTWLVVTRRDSVVRRIAVKEPEFVALAALIGGGTIADALEAAQSRWPGGFGQLASEVQRWFCDWSTAGYFKGIVDTDAPQCDT